MARKLNRRRRRKMRRERERAERRDRAYIADALLALGLDPDVEATHNICRFCGRAKPIDEHCSCPNGARVATGYHVRTEKAIVKFEDAARSFRIA